MNSIFMPQGFPGGSEGKAAACNAKDRSSIPCLGRSSGEVNGNPPQYCCLENPMDREAWQATVQGVAKRRTRLRTSLHSLIQASVLCKMRSLDKKVLMFSSPFSSTLKCIKLRCLIHLFNLLDRTLCSHCAQSLQMRTRSTTKQFLNTKLIFNKHILFVEESLALFSSPWSHESGLAHLPENYSIFWMTLFSLPAQNIMYS